MYMDSESEEQVNVALYPADEELIADLMTIIDRELRLRLGIDRVTEMGIYYKYSDDDSDNDYE